MSSSKFTAESPQADSTAPLLTVGDVVRLKAEIEADMNLLALLPDRIAQNQKRYEAALLFVPADLDVLRVGRTDIAAKDVPSQRVQPASPRPYEGGGDKLTWIGETRRIINASDRGLSYAEVLSELKALPLAPSVGDKGFYNSVARLEGKGEIVKAGGLVYSAQLASRQGLAPKQNSKNASDLGGTSGITLAVIKAHPAGLKAAELKRELQRHPDCPESMKKHGHYIYSVLSKLIDSGAVTKDSNGVYRAV